MRRQARVVRALTRHQPRVVSIEFDSLRGHQRVVLDMPLTATVPRRFVPGRATPPAAFAEWWQR